MSRKTNIRSLAGISPEVVHRAANEAFADYAVDVQMSQGEFETMCLQNSVDFGLSVGLFAGERMVGLWLNGARTKGGILVAYDSGTAIVAEHRGQGHAKGMGDAATRLLRAAGVQRWVLEVLQQNEKAYGIYLRDGFQVQRELRCLRTLQRPRGATALPPGYSLRIGPFDPALVPQLPSMEYAPSWQNETASMIAVADQVLSAVVRAGREIAGYGLIMPQRGRVTQLALAPELWDTDIPSVILTQLCQAAKGEEIAAINVDPCAERTLELLAAHGFERHVDQYEMSKPLGA